MDELQKLFKDIEQEIIRGEMNGDGMAENSQKKHFNILLRATTPEELKSFHTACDGKGATLTILHGRYNVWFGAYTCKSWSKGKKNPKEDSKAFLFYKNDNSRDASKFFHIKKKRKDRALTFDDNFGPTFGGKLFKDYDLQTFNLAAKVESEMKDDYMQLNGQINFGIAYKGEGPKPSRNEINGGTMEVKMLEIYQVVDGTPDNMWREKPTDDNVKKLMNDIVVKIPSPDLNIQAYNILLVGVINSGKSSFCNTLLSVFAEKIKSEVATASEARSVTNRVHMCPLSYKQRMKLPINIIDIRGYDKQRGYDHELQHLLDGELPMGYQFPEEDKEVSKSDLRGDPKLSNEVHLVCFVVDGQKIQAQQREENLNLKLTAIKDTVRNKNIQIAAVVTKLDLVCQSTKYDAGNVFSSLIAHEAVKKVAVVLGIEEKDVFPIVNFVNDTEIDPAKSRLAIMALHSMVHLAETKLEKPKEGKREALAKRIKNEIENLKQNSMLRILCVGEVNSGKTSFICSVRTALTGKACIDDFGRRRRTYDREDSYTKDFMEIKIDENITFGDMPGFQSTGEVDLKFVQEKCKIQTGMKTLCSREPEKNDRFHCVCIVIDITSFDKMSKKSSDLLTELMDWLTEKKMFFLIILTKIDLLNTGEIDKDLRDKIGEISKKFRIAEEQVIAVQNYVGREKCLEEVDLRLLSVLNKIVELWKENIDSDALFRGLSLGDGSDDTDKPSTNM